MYLTFLFFPSRSAMYGSTAQLTATTAGGATTATGHMAKRQKWKPQPLNLK